MDSDAIVFIRWKDAFFKLLRQYTGDPYDAVGIRCGKIFTVLNIYDGKKPKWWEKCKFSDFKENEYVENLCIHPFKKKYVTTLRLKIALSSAITIFSDKKCDLRTFLEDFFLRRQSFEERIGYLYVCKILENIEDKSIVKIEQSSILSHPYEVSSRQSNKPMNISKREIKNFFSYLSQLYLSHEIIAQKDKDYSKKSPQSIIKDIQDYLNSVFGSKVESPILELDQLINKLNELAEFFHVPPAICPEIGSRGMIVKTAESHNHLPYVSQDEEYCYLTKDGMGIEGLTLDQLIEVRRILDSVEELKMDLHELHFKINEELSKR